MTDMNSTKHTKAWFAIILALTTVILLSGVNPASARDGAIPDGMDIQPLYRSGPGKGVGRVQLIQGKAVIQHEKQDYAFVITNGMGLYNGDTIYTGRDCHLELVLNDDSNLVLSSDTKIVIDKSIYDPGTKSRLSFFQMLSGKARFIVKKLADYRHSQFNVKTESSVVGVRGSDFILEVSQQDGKTVITAMGHTILEIYDPANPLQEPVIINSFQQLVTVLGQVLGTPMDIPEEEIMKLLEAWNLFLLGGSGGTGPDDVGYGGYVPDGGIWENPWDSDFWDTIPDLFAYWPPAPLPTPILDGGPDNTNNDDPGDEIKPPFQIPELPDIPAPPR